jgi:hypothetical protein
MSVAQSGTSTHTLEILMFRTLGNLLDGLIWGFSMALGWILAFSVLGLVAA